MVNDGKLIAVGGRVLVVSAFASTLQQALDNAYAAIAQISFEGAVWRRDIAHRYVVHTVLC